MIVKNKTLPEAEG